MNVDDAIIYKLQPLHWPITKLQMPNVSRLDKLHILIVSDGSVNSDDINISLFMN